MGSRDHSIECERCGEMRGGMNDLLCECDSDYLPWGYQTWPSTLASNIAVAALGCWGFHRGTVYGYASANVACSQDSPDEWYPGRVLDERPCRECGRRFVPTAEDFGPDWCGCEPGCGRSAP